MITIFNYLYLHSGQAQAENSIKNHEWFLYLTEYVIVSLRQWKKWVVKRYLNKLRYPSNLYSSFVQIS